MFKSKEYPPAEKFIYYLNAMRTATVIFKNGIDVNLLELVKELKVPVIFIIGKYDLSTPLVLVEKFYQNVIAPKKELIVLENSVHMPQLEEFEKFNKIIITNK